MTTGAGFSSKAVWKKEGDQSDYGTPIECGANDQISILTEGLDRTIEKELDNVVRHKAGVGGSNIMTKGVQGSLVCDLAYRGLESLIISAMGFAAHSTSPETIVAGVYKHTIELAENMHAEYWTAGDGILAGGGMLAGDKKVRRGTLCIDKSVSIWEFISSMAQEMTITGEAKGCKAEFALVPYDLDRASATNTTTAAWSIANDDFDFVLFQDLDLWIADYSAVTPLDSGDAIGISALEIKLANILSVEQDSLSGLYIAEPKRDGKRRVTGSFTMPRYESDAFMEDLDDQSEKMAMIRFTGSQIGATGYYQTFWIWLPTIKFDKIDAPIGGPGIFPVTHTFTAELPAAAPAGFPTEATKEMVIQIQNDNSTNPLA